MHQAYDPRNKDLMVNINGQLSHRDEAGVSPFDSSVQNGDAVWEGLRVYDGKVFCLNEHLNRLLESAKSMAFEKIPEIRYIKIKTLRSFYFVGFQGKWLLYMGMKEKNAGSK